MEDLVFGGRLEGWRGNGKGMPLVSGGYQGQLNRLTRRWVLRII